MEKCVSGLKQVLPTEILTPTTRTDNATAFKILLHEFCPLLACDTDMACAGPQIVLAVGCHPQEDVIVTCGIDHLMFWRVAGARLKKDAPNFDGKGPAGMRPLGRAQTFLSVDFCYMQYQGYSGEYWEQGCPGGYTTLTASADGYVYIWEHNLLQKTLSMAHIGPIFDIFVPDKSSAIVFTAGQDGSVKVWNLADQTPAPQVMHADDRLIAKYSIEDQIRQQKQGNFAPSTRLSWSLRNVRCFGDPASIFVGTAGNDIYQMDMDIAVERLKHDEYGKHPDVMLTPRTIGCGFKPGASIVSLACHPEKLECVTTATGGCVRRWDIDAGSRPNENVRSPAYMLSARYISGSDCLCVDYSHDGKDIAIGLSDGRIVFADSVRLNIKAGEVDGGQRGPARALKFAPKSIAGKTVFAVAGGSGFIDLVSVSGNSGAIEGPGKVLARVKCDFIGGTPTLDWHCNADLLMTNATHQDLEWTVDSDTIIKVVPSSHGEQYEAFLASWSSPDGDAVSGIHAEDGMHAGVTCAHRSPNHQELEPDVRAKVVAYGDDFGKINLSAFPCKMDSETVGCHRRTAHDGPVGAVAFSYDGSLLVSVGTSDLCMMIWSVITTPPESTEFSDNLESVLSKFVVDTKPTECLDQIPAQEFDLVPEYYVGLVAPPGQEKIRALEAIPSLPAKQLCLTHCYSYCGFSMHGNVEILQQSRRFVYFAAGIGIVHNVDRNSQEFFTKHRASISCLAVHPSPDSDLVATGDMDGNVWVWDASLIEHSSESMDWQSGTSIMLRDTSLRGGIANVCFCNVTAAGSMLAVLGMRSRLVIYSWKLSIKVTETLTEFEKGRHVLSVNSDGKNQLVTSGVDHIKFWTLTGRSLSGVGGAFGKVNGTQQTFLCSKFVDSSTVVTGTQEGSIYVWSVNPGAAELIHIVKKNLAHYVGCDGPNEVFDICVKPKTADQQKSGTFHVLSGGGGRKAILWKFEKKGQGVTETKLHECVMPEHECCITDPSECVRAVSIVNEKLIIGTSFNSLYYCTLDSASEDPKLGEIGVLCSGHVEGEHKEGRINCVCCCPGCCEPKHASTEGTCPCYYLFVSGGSDQTLVLWDARMADKTGRKKIDTLKCDSTPMAIDWGYCASSRKSWIGVIFKSGQIRVLTVSGGNALTQCSTIDGKGCGSAIRFSPDTKYLVVGRRSGGLDFYGGSGDGQFAHLKRFKGGACHTGPCCALDWSQANETDQDPLFVRSNAYEPSEEVLFWQVLPGSQDPKDAVKQVRRIKDIEQCEWLREQCRVSWTSKGLIQREGLGPSSEYRPSLPVSSLVCAPSPQEMIMGCGCDDGILRLFAKPCLSIRAYGWPYHGHIDPIRAVAFASSTDTSWLISTSVNLAILQWKVVEPAGKYAHIYEHELSASSSKDSKITAAFNRLAQTVNTERWEKALEMIKEMYEAVGPTVDAEDKQKKLLEETKRMLKKASTLGSKIKQDVTEHLARGDVDRQGWPVCEKVESMKNMAIVFRVLEKHDDATVQAAFDDIVAIRDAATALEEQLTAITTQLHEGFEKIKVAEEHISVLDTIFAHVQDVLGSNDALPGVQGLQSVQEECNRCKEETAALDTVLQEAKQISELHTAGEFVDARRNTESLENQHKIICQQVFV